jgi:hypothetical protein
MTVIRFKKKLLCGKNCHQNFEKSLIQLVSSYQSGINGHTTILHSSPYHEIFCTFYDKGKHENHTMNGIVKTKFNKLQKKFSGKIPTKAELENF